MANPPVRSSSSSRPDRTLMSADGHTWVWRFRDEFGPWLRGLRETHGLTLRQAAQGIGTSFTRLQKLETGGRARPPTMEMLGRLATLYGIDLEQILAEAGFRMEVPGDLRDALRCDDAFAAVVLHPALRPACMDERWLEAFSRIQKAQWVEFARKLDAHARSGGPTVTEIVDEAMGANSPDLGRRTAKAS